MCFSVKWTGWHGLGSSGWDQSLPHHPEPQRSWVSPFGCHVGGTQVGLSPGSQLFTLCAAPGGWLWLAGEAVAGAEEAGLWVAGLGKEL